MSKQTLGLVILAGILLAVLAAALWHESRSPVQFADLNLEILVRELLDKPVADGDITRGELRQVIELDASGRDIRRLDGLEHMQNLRVLDLEDNFVIDLSPLARLRKLAVLNLRNNEITALEAINFGSITNLPLKELSLRHNVLRTETGGQYRISDISLLAKLTRLEKLELRDNHIRDITPLAMLTRLRELDISQNPLDCGDIASLADLIGLEELNLRETRLTSLETVANFTGLRYLNIHSNPELESIAPLAELVDLVTLIMRDVPVGKELHVLAQMDNLKRLNIRNTGTSDLTPVISLMERGALQDDLDQEIEAALDIRDNPIAMGGYEALRPYWQNITLFEADVDMATLPRAEDLSGEVLINEIMATNGFTIADSDGDFSDWIEIFNPGKEPIDLTGYYLSDKQEEPLRWQFPSSRIEPGGFLLVWASGKDKQLHTNFRLDREGEFLLLTRPDGKTAVDYVQPMPMGRDISFGRIEDGAQGWTFFAAASPRQANSAGQVWRQAPAPPVFASVGGYYNKPFDLTINAPGGAEIFYTLDGSIPTQDSLRYNGPIAIDDPSASPNLLSLIPTARRSPYTFWAPPRGLVEKGMVVRARVFIDDVPGIVATHTYFIRKGPTTLPVISISTDKGNLFDQETGIYVLGNNKNFSQRGRLWERQVHFELFEPDGTRGLAQNIGIRIHGGWSREVPMKSLRLYAREDYDQRDTFCYELFPGLTKPQSSEPLTSFYRLLLRNSGNDFHRTMFRDGLMQGLVAHTNVDTQAFRPTVVYINGEYWGIHNLRERYDDWYIHNSYGLERDDVVILADGLEVESGTAADAEHYQALLDYVRSQDMSQAEHYHYIQTQIDTENFIDFVAAHIYFANTDWPQNNVRLWRKRADYDPAAAYGHDGRWRWLLFDTDFGFGVEAGLGYAWGVPISNNTLARATDPARGHTAQLFRGLLTNPQFKTDFINRMADLVNTAFTPERVLMEIQRYQALIAPEMPRHIQRWSIPDSFELWEGYVDELRTFARQRPAHQLRHLQNHFGLSKTVTVTIKHDPKQGQVTVNSIAIAAATPGIQNPGSWTGTYFQGVELTITAIPARGMRFAGWQGRDESEPVLVINPNQDINFEPIFVSQ